MLQNLRGVDPDELEKITLEEFLDKTGQPEYRYPKFGGLKTKISQKRLGIKYHTWQQIIDELINQGLGS